MKTISASVATRIVKTYIHCWEAKDISRLHDIFEDDADYFERYYRHHFKGLTEITEYWKRKVMISQEEIRVSLKYIHIANCVVIPEWEVEFIDLEEGRRKQIYEVALMTISKDNKIQIHKEFWDTRYIDGGARIEGRAAHLQGQ